ncbi:MAG: SUF system Fe-S cluster assembly protein [Salinivirgaceae bacterium]|jgi:FeS assembly SUF system protein|nr:SUF system Fe-S cluster assembly protein [Salinivirgaceae bacterium]
MANIINEQEVVEKLKQIYDPEIPVNIYDLGLIYKIDIDDENVVEVLMTLTAPNCPVAPELVANVTDAVKTIEGVTDTFVNLTFDPPWDQEMMSEEAKLELGFL